MPRRPPPGQLTGRPLFFAQRAFPSMMTATWRGRFPWLLPSPAPDPTGSASAATAETAAHLPRAARLGRRWDWRRLCPGILAGGRALSLGKREHSLEEQPPHSWTARSWCEPP